MHEASTQTRPRKGFLFSLVLMTFSFGQIIGILSIYQQAFYLSEIIRETQGSLVNGITGEPVTIINLTIYLFVNTLFCQASLIGLYGVWQWKKWGVYIVIVMGLLYLVVEIFSGTSFYDLRLGLGLIDFTRSSAIYLGSIRIESPIPTIVALGVGMGRAIYRRWQWFD